MSAFNKIPTWGGTTWLTANKHRLVIDRDDSYKLKINLNGTVHTLLSEASGIASVTALDFTGAEPTQSPISFSGVTLASSTNAIRGIDVVPTRVSGWTCFTGTLSGVSAYTDYRELHTAGSDICYGFGTFGFADSGFSGNTLLSLQAISTISAGATLTSGSVLNGAYAAQFKMLWDGATASSGMVTAVASFLYQANTTQVSAYQSSVIQLSIDSGTVRSVIDINQGTGGATSLIYFSSATVTPLTTGGSGTPTAASGTWYNLRFNIAGTTAYMPISTAAWTNA